MRTGSILALTTAALLCSILPVLAQGRQGQQVQLPEGNGKELVQTTCSRCHALNLVTESSGNTREGWETLFSSMVAVPKGEAAPIAEYLAKNFPLKPAPPAVLIPGATTVSIKEWLVPSLGSRPHDPLAAADGSLWWSGQWANVLGRLDPKAAP
jgi:virginiamycin B lyase